MTPAPPPFDRQARDEMTEWLASWARIGPILERRRVAELRQLKESESARIAVELIWPMVPVGPGDAGEGLRPLQRALRLLAGRR